MTETDFIDISGEEPLWRGAFRVVYADPRDSRKLIKVMHHDGQLRSRRRRRVWRKSGQSNGNEREMSVVRALQKMSAYDLAFFPEFFGVVETDQGEGLVFENLQKTNNGEILRPDVSADRTEIKKLCSLEFLLAHHEKMASKLVDLGILSTALNIENIALIGDDAAGWTLKTFDLKEIEDLRLIPLSKFSKLERKRRARRFYESMRNKIIKAFAAN